MRPMRILPKVLLPLLLFALILPWCYAKHSKGTAEENRATSVVTTASTNVQQPIIQGQSSLIFYGWLGPPLGSKLPECAGDCDGDGDCENGLQCFGNTGEEERNAEKVPGCSGFRYVNSDGIKSDYCYNPSKLVANRADIPEDSYTLLFVGRDTGFVMGRCQGDCRVNRDCRGSLECYEEKGDTVPGCEGKREKGVDYCFDPNWKEESKENAGREESASIQEEKPLDITDDLVSIEEQESSNDIFIPETPEPTPDPRTSDPTTNPTKEPSMKPTKAPSRRPTPAPITDEPTLPSTLPDESDDDPITEEKQIPTVEDGKPTLSPTLATEPPTTDPSTLSSPISLEPESSQVPVSTTTVELVPFTLILDFHTPKRHLRGLIIQENVDEDEELLDIVSGLIERRLFQEYPGTFLALEMDAEFMDEVEIDSVTSAAYSLTGEATFNDIDGSDIPSTQEMTLLSQKALNERDLIMKLRESDDIILELTAGATVLINADNNSESLPPKREDAPTQEAEVESRTEQPPGDSGGSTNNSLRMTAIVLCSVLGATAIGLLAGYFYVRRKEKRERQMYMYELESSDSRGELQEAAPKRSILHPFSSPIKQKGTFDTQESHSPSPQQQQQIVRDFEDAELPDLSLPDLDDGYSIGIESCDFSYTQAKHNRTISDMSNLSQTLSSRRFEEVDFPSSTSIAGGSIAEDTQASSTIAAATVMTGTLTGVVPMEVKNQSGQSDSSVNGSDPSESRDQDDMSSSDGDLCELGNVHLSSVLDINDGATVASKENNFDQVWRRTKGENSGESDNTDSIIDLKMDESPSDDDDDDEEGWNESRSRKFSFDGDE